jgi:hypothetical protein
MHACDSTAFSGLLLLKYIYSLPLDAQNVAKTKKKTLKIEDHCNTGKENNSTLVPSWGSVVLLNLSTSSP